MSNDKHHHIASWIYQQGTFVSISDIESEFSLSRASLYREIEKIQDRKSGIKYKERRCKINSQWHCQIHVHSININPIDNNIKNKRRNIIFYPFILNELITKNGGSLT
jgi:hypothetical protein